MYKRQPLVLNPHEGSLEKLESLFGYKHSVACNTTQTAIQACLEILGTRTHMVPVVMPVTAPPDALAAVLRAGAQPVLLDIDRSLQMDPVQLEMVLQDLESAVVLLTRPAGLPVNPKLLELAADVPTIGDFRLEPHPHLQEWKELCTTFNIFDFSTIIGTGSLIIHKFPEQVDQLRLVRSGVMGLSGTLPDVLASQLVEHYEKVAWLWRHEADEEEKGAFRDEATALGIKVITDGRVPYNGVIYAEVPNARAVQAYLSNEIETALGVYPLYNLEEVRRRYQEEPDYPMAASLENRIICLPFHAIENNNSRSYMLEKIKEIM